MLPQDRPTTHRVPVFGVVLIVIACVVSSTHAFAQDLPSYTSANDQKHASLVVSVVKGIVLDPTTYAPALLAYDSTMRDWKSSQPFFRNGYRERNAAFTISGLPNDVPIGYEEGSRVIVIDALRVLQISALSNVSSRVTERWLISRFSEHRRLIRTIGWIQRCALASYLSYTLSADHYRQWRQNEQLAEQMGYR